MAQRTVHIAFSKLVSSKIAIKDYNSFYFGSILPDAYKDTALRKITHFVKELDEEYLYLDFHDFYLKFKNEIINDDLYYGYYAHLIEDALYRYHLYYKLDYLNKMDSYVMTVFHDDYHILNEYIFKKYNLPKDIYIPEDFLNKSLSKITDFDIDKLVRDYIFETNEHSENKTKMLTEDVIDTYINDYLKLIIEELISVRNGSSILNPEDYKWPKRKK